MPRTSNKQNKNIIVEKSLRKVRIDDLNTFDPITDKQRDTFKAFEEQNNLLLHGLAGTGKTFISLYLALEEVLDASSEIKNITIIRSIVPTRNIGFLKGDDQEKIEVYEAPYKAICEELFDVKEAYNSLKSQGVIKFMPTSFIRGSTINDSIIIVDEFENLNFHELDSVITRVGKNSRLILCGDYTQSDFTKTEERQGCISFMKILKQMSAFTFIEFGINDIVRSTLVRDYIINKYKLGLNI
jgi:phosphate starvation-inducible PhoH-like protein